MPQEELRQAMPGPEEIGTDVLPTAQRIPGRLVLLGRNMDGGQGAGPIQHRQLAQHPANPF